MMPERSNYVTQGDLVGVSFGLAFIMLILFGGVIFAVAMNEKPEQKTPASFPEAISDSPHLYKYMTKYLNESFQCEFKNESVICKNI